MGAFLPPPGQPSPKMDPNFKSTSLPAITRFAWTDIQPPSPLYVLRDDVLFLQAINANTGATETVTFNYRFLRVPEVQGGQPSGQGSAGDAGAVVDYGIIDTGQDQILLPAGVSQSTKTRTLGEGWLLTASASCAGALQRGQTFVRMLILRGGNTVQNAAQTLFEDYITNPAPGGYPGGRIVNPGEGIGWRKSLQVANPAPGADWTMTVPSFIRRSVVSFSATFTAAVAIASRNINVIVDDGANIVWQDDVSAAVTASQVASINGTQTNAPAGIIATTLFVVLPPGLVLPQGFRVRSSTGNIQGADQWSAIWFLVEDYLDQL